VIEASILTACYFQDISRYLNNLSITSVLVLKHRHEISIAADLEEGHWVKKD